MRLFPFILLFSGTSASVLIAQNTYSEKPFWLNQKSPLYLNSIPKVNFIKPVNEKTSTIISGNRLCYKHEIPKGAVFCRMEDILYSKSNIWFKLRAGTDEWYNSVIKEKSR